MSLIRTLLVVGLVIGCSSVHAQTAAEISEAAAYLTKTRDAVLAKTKGLSDAQYAFKPAPERWSVAEVLEHIASTEGFLMELVRNQAMKGPARPAGEDVKAIDALVLKAIPDRSQKAKAPEPLLPTKRFGSPEGSRKSFAESRAATIAYLKETKGLRDHAIDSPMGKKLDGYQWLLFIGAHSERHLKQIEEVMGDAGFPKKG